MNKDDEEKLIKQIASLPLDEQEREIFKMHYKARASRLSRPRPRRELKLKDYIEDTQEVTDTKNV